MGTTTLAAPLAVAGATPIGDARVDGKPVAWGDLARTTRTGKHSLSFGISTGSGARMLLVPPCAGVETLGFDAAPSSPPGEPDRRTLAKGSDRLTAPRLVAIPPGAKTFDLALDVGSYESRIACGFAPAVGAAGGPTAGVATLTFASSNAHKDAGAAYVYLPSNFATNPSEKRALLVAPHPWGGDAATYLRYAELFAAADADGVVVLFPSGLGNSLYTAPAERETMLALDAVMSVLPIDSERIGIWGASMGGAGATTIGYHHPDRFNVVASFFGDSRYDRKTYVRSILTSDAAAQAVNADDVAENGLHLTTILVHGTADKVSPPKQTTLFCDHLKKLGYSPTCTMLAGRGHEGGVVAQEIAAVVHAVATVRSPAHPSHVRFRTVRPSDDRAYGVRLLRADASKPAYIDVEARAGSVVVHASENVKSLGLANDALGLGTGSAAEIPVTVDAGVAKVTLLRDTATER